jgi:type I restriction enzyme S subunit
MCEWDSDALGALASFQKGRKVVVNDHLQPGYAPYIGASVLDGGPPTEFACTTGAVLADIGDVLMLWDGERSGLVGRWHSGVVSSTVAKLSPKPKIDADLLYYLLGFYFEWIQGRRTGTGVPHVPKDLSSILVLRYPRDFTIQRRIAEILSTVDEAIEHTEALIAKTQQIKAGLMQDLFTRGVTPDGKLRPPREEALGLYKESSLGWIPKEWEDGRLSDKRGSGRAYIKTGPFGTSLKLEHWVEVGRPVITIGALGEGEFISGELLHVSEVTAERLRDYQLDVGDVVFSRVADVGRSAVIGEEQRGWIMSSNLMRISLDRGQVVPAFLQAQLAYDGRLRRQIRATVNSGGRDVANSAILNRLRFCWPSKQEQERIAERSAAVEARRQVYVMALEKMRLTKAGLMHDLLTGLVRVPTTHEQKVAADV